MHTQYPMRPTHAYISGRAILSAAVVQIPDVDQDREYLNPDAARVGIRSLLAVPILRNTVPIGAIVIYGPELGPFPDKHIELLRTFADQAVIAIENVRLFTELQEKNRALTEAHAQMTEALEQQTATSEVLKVISRSTFDLQPVLDTLIENATKLCDAPYGALFRLDGEMLHVGALYHASPELTEVWQRGALRPGRDTCAGRVALTHRTVQILDVLDDPEYQPFRAQRVAGARTVVGVPMLREGSLIGVIVIWRTEVRAFTDKHIELVTTFADQAVIAIENVRLFTELQARNHELTAAFEREAASADLLRIIAASPTDLTPVFESILDRALILCGATVGGVLRYDGGLISLATAKGPPESVAAVGATYPRRLDDSGLTVRSIRERRTVHVADTLADPSSLIVTRSIRGQLSVPMLKDGKALGSIVVTRPEPGLFSDGQVKLLETFADQAVIAIENVRLFTELQEKNRALTEAHAQVTEALEQQTATSDILRVIIEFTHGRPAGVRGDRGQGPGPV